ncbi:AEC family transporter [Actibacterium sp.]|uniref:AEC family transporter n=1 Tax=Actibacterium sp. TaxID=1872125 RepID=UPI00356A56DE
MNLVLTVLEIVAPVFLLAAVGFGWVKMGFEYRVEFVTRLAMTLSVPCLIFVALMKTDIDPQALTTLSLASAAAYGAVTAVFFLGLRLAGLDIRTYLAPLIFGNTGNMGLPLAIFAFGNSGLGYAVVVFAVMAIYSFTFGIWLVSGGGSPLKVIKEPLVAGTVLGGIFLWQGWETPKFLTNALELIGQMAIPVMLITLGVAVARLRPGKLGQALVLSSFKIGTCVAIAAVIGRAFGLAPEPFAVLVVQVSTPVAVTSYLLAEKYGADSDAVAGLVVVSTLLSVATIPLTLAFLL